MKFAEFQHRCILKHFFKNLTPSASAKCSKLHSLLALWHLQSSIESQKTATIRNLFRRSV